MSFESKKSAGQVIALGNVLPSGNGTDNQATHLYISMSEMISECVFYHPGLVSDQSLLNESDQQALHAMLGEQDLSEHFVETLTNKIKLALTESAYTSIRLCLSEADSYEYKALLGGGIESDEVNPAMGLRGVSRLSSASYGGAFTLQCEVIKALQLSGIEIEIVVPFVRALSDAATIIDRLAEQGLPRGLNGLKVLYSCDVPSAALLADKLLQYFDGVVINVDHLTQFTLGVDKYNEELEYLYKSDNEAVTSLMTYATKSARMAKKPVIVVATAISEHPKLAEFLSDSLKPDVVFSF